MSIILRCGIIDSSKFRKLLEMGRNYLHSELQGRSNLGFARLGPSYIARILKLRSSKLIRLEIGKIPYPRKEAGVASPCDKDGLVDSFLQTSQSQVEPSVDWSP